MNVHNDDIAEVYKCMKKLLGTNPVTEAIIEDIDPGIMRRLEPSCFKKQMHKLSRNRYLNNVFDCCGHFKSIFSTYLDVTMDVAILKTMITVIGSTYIITNYENVQSQIVLAFACTIFLPFLANGLFFNKHAVRALGLKKRTYTTCQSILIHILVTFLSPLLPAKILYRKRCCRAKIDKLDEDAFAMSQKVKENKKTIADLEEENAALDITREHYIGENETKIANLKEQNELHEKHIDETARQVRMIEKENKKLRSLVAVSYTHLTLPTICSV